MTALTNARSVDQAAVCQWTDRRTRVRDCSTSRMIFLPPGTSDPHPRCYEIFDYKLIRAPVGKLPKRLYCVACYV